jgi:cytochrome b561
MELPKRYHPVHVTLHWLIALGIFINLYLGIFVFTQRGRGVFQFQTIHMVVGITILVLLLVRLVMRFTIKRPADATAGHRLLDIVAKVVHYGLYLSVLAVTILGLVFALQTNRLQSAFTGSRPEFNGARQGFNGPPPGFTPPAPGTFPNGRGGGFGFGSPLLIIHRLVAYLVALLLGIHILAALYHQFIRKDNLLARMWYGSR